MTKAQRSLKGWLSQNSGVIFPLMAFTVPLLARFIPELLMGQFPTGFDPMGYYIPNTLLWLKNGVDFSYFLSLSPLLYMVLLGLTSMGASIVISIKILGPLLLGLVGLFVYLYANRALFWSPKKSLLVTVFATLYFVALRISWDMLRSELAIVFLFISLLLISQQGHKKRNGLLLSLVMVLLVLSHQLIAVVFFFIIIAYMCRFAFRKEKLALLKIFLPVLPAAAIFSVILYLNGIVFSGSFGGGLNLFNISHFDLVGNTWGFLAFCYLPLIPLLVFGFKRFKGKFALIAWIAWLFIPIIIATVSPNALFMGGVLPYRWILLLIYPLAFFAVEGLTTVKWNLYKVVVCFVLAFLSVSFMVLPNNESFGFFGVYSAYGPKSMLENTVQLSDCQDTVNALVWAQNNLPNQGYLYVHECFFGWALLNFNSNRIVPYFFGNLTDITQKLVVDNASSSTYLIWWVNGTGWYGQQNVPSSFKELHHSGDIAIYQFSTGT